MSERYEVGEIAILAEPSYHTEYKGEECLIMSPLQIEPNAVNLWTMKVAPREAYHIEMPDGTRFNAAPHQLKKKPKKEDSHDTIREAETS